MEKRDTCDQPTVFFDKQGNKRFNVRKITELPRFAVNLTFALRAQIISEIIYFDYEFIAGMFACLSFQEIIEVAQLALKVDPFASVHIKKDLGELMIDLGN